MRVIGLTGGVASGKSTVSRWISDLGVPVVDADATVHRLYRPGQSLHRKLRRAFGEQIIDEDGEINREILGQWAFSDPRVRRRLEHITHPVVREEMLRELGELAARGYPCAVADVPLLFEVGWEKLADETWVVYCHESQQVERLQLRRGLNEIEARKRVSVQMPLTEKARRADLVIDNSGTLEETRAQVAKAVTERCGFHAAPGREACNNKGKESGDKNEG